MNFGNAAILNVSTGTESTFTLMQCGSAEINIGEGGAGTVGMMSAFGR